VKRRRRSRNAFPNHAIVKPLLKKPSATQILPTYNPRIESPFPTCPEPGLAGTLQGIQVRANSAPVAATDTSSNGLFTPVRGSMIGEDLAKSRYYTVPRGVDTKSFAGKSVDFGDAKDFILAVPEPLALKPRSAGKPPAVTRHLEKYGTPHSNSPSKSDKLLHPNKLFHAIQKNSIRSSYCSSTTMRIDRQESHSTSAVDATEMVDMVDKAIEEEAEHLQYIHDNSDTSSKYSLHVGQSGEPATNADLTALHRLRSYRSLTGGRDPMPVRTGTVTRSKTPIDELRRFYGGEESVPVPSLCLSQYATASTIGSGFELGSENGSVSTPATSPILQQCHLNLLPTPLRPHRVVEKQTQTDKSELHRRESSFDILAEKEANYIPSFREVLDRKREKRGSQGFYHANRRSKPPPPNIKTNLSSLSAEQNWPIRSFTETYQVAEPHVDLNQLRKGIRSSSMYSGDTRGFSLVRTPTTVDGSGHIATHYANSGVTASANPFRSRESIRSRIDEWNQRIEGIPLTPQLPRSKQVSPVISTSSIRDHFEAIKKDDNPSHGHE